MGRDFGNAFHFIAERMIYHQSFIKTTKSALATLLMSYLMYYSSDNSDGAEEKDIFVRTMEEIQENTGMTRSEICRARKTLVKLNWISYKVKDAPPKTYYKIEEGFDTWWNTRPAERKA